MRPVLPGPQAIKADIAAGAIGEPYFFEFREMTRWSPGTYGYADWDEIEKGSAPFWGSPDGIDDRYIWHTKCVHYLDLTRFLADSNIASAYVTMGRHGGLEVLDEDFAYAMMTTRNGIKAIMHNQWGSHHSGRRGADLTGDTRIEGEAGTILVSKQAGSSHGVYQIWQERRCVKEYEIEMDWPRAFDEGRELMGSARDYLKVAWTLEAGYESGMRNAVVTVPDS